MKKETWLRPNPSPDSYNRVGPGQLGANYSGNGGRGSQSYRRAHAEQNRMASTVDSVWKVKPRDRANTVPSKRLAKFARYHKRAQ